MVKLMADGQNPKHLQNILTDSTFLTLMSIYSTSGIALKKDSAAMKQIHNQ